MWARLAEAMCQLGRSRPDVCKYLLRVLNVLVLADPPLGELSPVVRHLVHQHAASKGPHTSKDKLVLQQLLIRWWCPTH